MLDHALSDSDDYSIMTHTVAEGVKPPHQRMDYHVLNQVDEVQAESKRISE